MCIRCRVDDRPLYVRVKRNDFFFLKCNDYVIPWNIGCIPVPPAEKELERHAGLWSERESTEEWAKLCKAVEVCGRKYDGIHTASLFDFSLKTPSYWKLPTLFAEKIPQNSPRARLFKWSWVPGALPPQSPVRRSRRLFFAFHWGILATSLQPESHSCAEEERRKKRRWREWKCIDLTYINILPGPNCMFYLGIHALFISYEIKQGSGLIFFFFLTVCLFWNSKTLPSGAAAEFVNWDYPSMKEKKIK